MWSLGSTKYLEDIYGKFTEDTSRRQIVIFRSDIKDLAKLFDQFGDSQMIGIANDLTPHYWKRYIMVNWSISYSLTSD